jgi:hypothetical protein
MENHIIKKTDKKSISISLSLTAAGTILFIIPGITNITGLPGQIIFFIALIVFITGLVRLFFNHKSDYYTVTGSRVRSSTYYFKMEDYNLLTNSLNTGYYEKVPLLKDENHTGVRVDFKITLDRKFATFQIFRYIPFRYEADSEPVIVPENMIDKFFIMLNNLKR